uniref:Uncharacterized protein n=1 Tax=Anguilla anguilla TaxID=7936 RepID=A0A0E9XMC7_ANGAN
MWKKVIWSDESSFTICLTSGRVHVWRAPRGWNRPECLTPTVRGSGGSVMPWGAWFGSTCPFSGKGHCKSTQSYSE